MRLTLDIQEDKIAFFLELIRNFDFVRLDEADKFSLHPEHLSILEERLADYEAAPDNFISWEAVKSNIIVKNS